MFRAFNYYEILIKIFIFIYLYLKYEVNESDGDVDDYINLVVVCVICYSLYFRRETD